MQHLRRVKSAARHIIPTFAWWAKASAVDWLAL
jgi:hypothetical protein